MKTVTYMIGPSGIGKSELIKELSADKAFNETEILPDFVTDVNKDAEFNQMSFVDQQIVIFKGFKTQLDDMLKSKHDKFIGHDHAISVWHFSKAMFENNRINESDLDVIRKEFFNFLKELNKTIKKGNLQVNYILIRDKSKTDSQTRNCIERSKLNKREWENDSFNNVIKSFNNLWSSLCEGAIPFFLPEKHTIKIFNKYDYKKKSNLEVKSWLKKIK